MTRRRPDVPAIICEAARGRRGSLAVVICGPASLADDAQAGFVSELKRGKSNMELFIEACNWKARRKSHEIFGCSVEKSRRLSV